MTTKIFISVVVLSLAMVISGCVKRYQVNQQGTIIVRLDTWTGKAWLMMRTEHQMTWISIDESR